MNTAPSRQPTFETILHKAYDWQSENDMSNEVQADRYPTILVRVGFIILLSNVHVLKLSR